MTTKTLEKTSVPRYLFNIIWVTVILNLALFPGLAWLFYHGKESIGGAVVGTEIFFGGLICTLIIGITGHLEAACPKRGCVTCMYRNHCPFGGIFLLGLGFGALCVTASHFYLGNADVPLNLFLKIKAIQGIFLAIAIPLAMVGLKLLINPEVTHKLKPWPKGFSE